MPLFDLKCSPCDFILKDQLVSQDTKEDPHCPYCKGKTARMLSFPAAIKFKAEPYSFMVDGKKCTVEPEIREFNEKTGEPEGTWQG